MGSLYKRVGSNNWMMAVTVSGRQVAKSTHTTTKRLAEQLLKQWETKVFEGRFHLPRSRPPFFQDWMADFLKKISRPNTHKRYFSSVGKLNGIFKGTRLSEITAEQVEGYKGSKVGGRC
jgi:hypothetical protein